MPAFPEFYQKRTSYFGDTPLATLASFRASNVHEAKTNLPRLLDAAERGEEVVITRRGTGINRFLLVAAPLPVRAQLFGALRGQIRSAADYDRADGEITEMFDAVTE